MTWRNYIRGLKKHCRPSGNWRLFFVALRLSKGTLIVEHPDFTHETYAEILWRCPKCTGDLVSTAGFGDFCWDACRQALLRMEDDAPPKECPHCCTPVDRWWLRCKPLEEETAHGT